MSTHQHKRRFLINAISSSLQSVVVAGTLFFLYRFLLHTIAVEHIGIWSVIFAAASIGKLAEMGVSAGVVKFVSAYLAREDAQRAASSIRTAASATSLGIGLCMILAYFSAPLYLSLLVGARHEVLAQSVLGLALVSFWLSSVASVYQSGLDGCHRMDFRSALNIATTLLHFTLCIILTPSMGLYGLGLSQIVQSLVTMIGNQVMLQRVLPAMRYRFWGWNGEQLRELLRYGLNAQLASVSITLLSEPITKAFISATGGLGVVAYYDMATRIISQLRSVVLSAFQAMVPMVSHIQEHDASQLKTLYVRSSRSMADVAIPMFVAVAALAPLISQVWIGRIESVFVYSSAVLSIGWCLNTLIVPAYMMNLGTGDLRWNTISHLIIGFVNTLFGWILSRFYGAEGAIVGWSLALSLGSIGLLYGFHKQRALAVTEVFEPRILSICVVGIGLSVGLPLMQQALNSWSFTQRFVASIAILCLAFLPFLRSSVLFPSLRRVLGTHLAKQ